MLRRRENFCVRANRVLVPDYQELTQRYEDSMVMNSENAEIGEKPELMKFQIDPT